MDFEEGSGRVSNVIVLALSFTAIVGVILGFTANCRSYQQDPGSFNAGLLLSSPSNSSRSSHKSSVSNSSALDFICLLTDYVPTCRNSLALVSNDKNATYDECVNAAINEATKDANVVKELSKQLATNSTFRTDQQALYDCIELLSLGLFDLKAALRVASNSSEWLNKQSADVKNWLSAVLAFKEACRDGLKHKKTKLIMNNGFKNFTEKTSNALAIFDSRENTKNSSDIVTSRRPISNTLQPDAIVAADGSGQFRTIGEAVKSYRLNNNGWYVIYVKAGVYNEHVFISRNQTNVYMYGDGIDKTIVYDTKHAADGFSAYRTATIAVLGDGFVCKLMTIQNRETSSKETVALRVQADKAAIFQCKIEGSQRSLYALANRQFYRECIITGSDDIIFGDSATIIQKSRIIVRKSHIPGKFNTVTAQGRTERTETTGFVLHDCVIIREKETDKTPIYLGRPGGRYSQTVVLQSYIGNVIDPKGWRVSRNQEGGRIFFAEFENNGPGAETGKRLKMEGFQVIKSRSEAEKFTPSNFIQGNLWLAKTGVPFLENLL